MLKRALFIVAPVLVALALPGPVAHADPECSTFDTRNEPTSGFRAGEPIVIRGTGFGMRTTVVATFRQGVRAAELARVQTSDLGAFSTPASAIPDTAEPGNGVLVIVDGPRSATCNLTIEAGKARSSTDSDTPTMLFIAWGIALAVVAGLLAVVSLRRWQRSRLNRAMADLAAEGEGRRRGDDLGEKQEAAGRVPWLELDDVEIVELGADELKPSPLDDDDEEDEEDEDADGAEIEDDELELPEDELQDLIDELEQDHDDEERPPRRTVHRETMRESAYEDSFDLPDEPASPAPRRRDHPRSRPARTTSNVDRLRDAVKDWPSRGSDSSRGSG
jgi:hypothetical protein